MLSTSIDAMLPSLLTSSLSTAARMCCQVSLRLSHESGMSTSINSRNQTITSSLPFLRLCKHENAFSTLPEISRNEEHRITSQYFFPSVHRSRTDSQLTINEITDHLKSLILPDTVSNESITIEEPMQHINHAIVTLPKSDIYWRRRRMRRHKLLRWRTKYPQIVRMREKRKLDNREKKQRENLEDSWKRFHLDSEPPKLTEEEKRNLIRQWEEEGEWKDSVTFEEYKNFAKIVRIMEETDKK